MTIAVIGAGTGRAPTAATAAILANYRSKIGPIGLAALKNLREEGFEATIFEKYSTIGGVWNFNLDPTVTSVLESKLDT